MVCLTWLSPLSPPLVPSLAWSSTGCWKILFSREYDCGVCNGWLALVLIMLLATYDEILENYLVTRWSSLGDNELSWENFFCLCLIGWCTRKRFSCVCRKKNNWNPSFVRIWTKLVLHQIFQLKIYEFKILVDCVENLIQNIFILDQYWVFLWVRTNAPLLLSS